MRDWNDPVGRRACLITVNVLEANVAQIVADPGWQAVPLPDPHPATLQAVG